MLLFFVFLYVTGFVYKADTRVNYFTCRTYLDYACILEGMEPDIWPHTIRWTFEWRSKICNKILWGDYCGPPENDTNNFASERRCYNDCGGLSK